MPLDEIGFALPKTLLVFNELLTGLSGRKIKVGLVTKTDVFKSCSAGS